MKREIHFLLVPADSIDYTDSIEAHPLYSDGFSTVIERESQQIFFREKLNDKLTFISKDFDWIMSKGFGARINITITIIDVDMIRSWNGTFVRTDCTINEVDKTLVVTPTVVDAYSKILSIMDVEFNLAELPLPTSRILINVPSVLQIYKPGDNFITNYWQGEVWEMDVEPITNTSTLESLGFGLEDFVHYPYFYCRILHSSTGTGDVNDAYNVNNDAYTMWNVFDHWSLGFGIVENTIYSNDPTIYGQVYDAQGLPTGLYYTIPVDSHYIYMPLRQRMWNSVSGSMWLRVEVSKIKDIDDVLQTIPLYANYTIGDVLRGLFAANSLSLNFQDNENFSQFLYSNENPITGWNDGWRLNITAKSNIIKLGAASPAQKVPCTLGTILNFLKNALNVYWSIDTANNFRLEHISYYKNGGSYTGTPITQFDLTQLINLKNRKPWAFGQYQYQFEKYTMPQYVKWEWMDATDIVFDGTGFTCKSEYVQDGNKEEINIANISTNIAKMIMMPDKFSLEGLAVIWTAGNNRTDYYDFTRDIGGEYQVANGQLAMQNLQQSVLLYDAPCDKIEVSGVEHEGVDYKRTKYNEVEFPANYADPYKHITTAVGDGAVDSMQFNLVNQSIKVKLKYAN